MVMRIYSLICTAFFCFCAGMMAGAWAKGDDMPRRAFYVYAIWALGWLSVAIYSTIGKDAKA